MADEDFGAASGASLSTPIQASALRKGGFVLIKEKPCKIVEMSSSKTGKHGHAKIHFVAMDIFENKKLEDICPSTHNMQTPIVTRKECQAVGVDLDDGYISLFEDDVEVQIKADEEMVNNINKLVEEDGSCLVTVLKAMGKEKIIDCKKEM